MPLLTITNLHVSVDGTEVVKGIDLTIEEGEIHAIMGPNGSGKSTLVNALMGHPKYEITKGTVEFHGQDLLKMEPHERSQAGLFLAFQYPKEIAGITLRSFLFAAYKLQTTTYNLQPKNISPIKFKRHLEKIMKELKMDPSFAERSLNQGFSGGEKKKAEVLQMKVLLPTLALLDETDSGLDIDALKIVADGINSMRQEPLQPTTYNLQPFSALLVTHYARILDYVKPDHVHIMIDGRVVESGGAELAKRLEEEGYEALITE